MRAFKQLTRCGHIYKKGREIALDPAEYLTGSEKIVETRDLPGFTHDGVTYESHHFYIHFCRYERDGRNPSANPSTRRFSSVLVIVNHGGGWEVWSGDYMLAAALHRYGDDNMGAFWLCWYLLDSTKEALHVGRHEASREYRQAFAEGRLKKRKLPRQNSVKIWIEPPATVEAVA